MALISSSAEWKALAAHAAELQGQHLRTLMQDAARNAGLVAEFEGLYLDYSRQRVTPATMDLLHALARAANVPGKIQAMVQGVPINTTENRAVMHVALRAAAQDTYQV
jgi:glucose-6-phosphate isomerase